MIALIVGIVFVLFAVYSVLPVEGWGIQWWDELILVLKGGLPLLAAFVGLIAVLIGVADIRDRLEAKKEEATEAQEADNASTEKSSEKQGE